MTFDKKIKDKNAAGGYGIRGIFKDTFEFVSKNRFDYSCNFRRWIFA